MGKPLRLWCIRTPDPGGYLVWASAMGRTQKDAWCALVHLTKVSVFSLKRQGYKAVRVTVEEDQ